MIENKELGLKIAENPREELIEKTLENMKERIVQEELQVEIDQAVVKFLKKLKGGKKKDGKREFEDKDY